MLGRSPVCSNVKDYFTGYAGFHGKSIILWIKSGWIKSERGPAIPFTCVKRWHFCIQSRLMCYKIVRKSVRTAFFGKQSMQMQHTNCSLYSHHGNQFYLRCIKSKAKCKWDLASKNSIKTRKINGAAFELV